MPTTGRPPSPKPIPAWFKPWAAWIRSGKHGARPANAPKRIPAWAWAEELETRPHPTPPPVHVTPEAVRLARNVIFCAENPLAMRDAPRRYAAQVTADPGYRRWLSDDVIAELRGAAKGSPDRRRVGPWCDCRYREGDGRLEEGEPTGTPLAEAFHVAALFDLDEPIGQAESPWELAHATGIRRDGERMTALERRTDYDEERTVRIVAGNPNAWTPQQRSTAARLCAAGELALIVECYTNVQGPWPEGFSTQGVPVASWLLGVYDGELDHPPYSTPATGAPRYIPGAEYLEHTPPADRPHVGVYHASSVREGWGWLP